MKDKTIILAGGTGFIGQALAARWGKDNRVIILSRQRPRERGRWRSRREHNRNPREYNNSYGRKLLSAGDGYDVSYRHWNGRQVTEWAAVLDGCDLVVNLAGRSVNCRYNAHNKREIFDSRTDATEAIGEAIRRTVTPPKLWVNIASATIYRHAEDRAQDEYTGETGEDFSVAVCKRWESCFFEKRPDSVYRLHLYSHFTLKTDFNFYAGWWAGWIMKDIQNNILQVIKTRCAAKL
jgi:NAD dependent epimerase/dehydratase family enzyme